jgi:ribokinase
VIVVVGSLNVDLVVPVSRFPTSGETLLGGDYARHPGGKGANQAVAAARAGARVHMLGRVGDDAFGAWLVRGLEDDGIDTGGVRALAGVPTGVAFISVDEHAQNCIIVSPGANARLAPDDLAAAAFEGARVVLLQLEVPLPTVLAAARLGRAAGARVVLNLAPAQALGRDALSDVDVLIVNEHEAALLLADHGDAADTGTTGDAVRAAQERAARRLTELVPSAVVTLGADGAVWAEGGESGTVPGFAVEAVDTTAAGDAFVGALGAALADGGSVRDALRFACAAGALAVTRPGAQPSLPRADEIRAFLEERG